eukprot:TRINITY_DN6131_c0_g1_i1.p1 TRINITY_DN6131_c0_g1~~TRINITY_DN6131_c0_g1_i1.p1  ORF type:complete len:360 (-),score=111.73 TRINITY_DN6131_c0_g1_i1:167-1246(-)
MQSSFALREGLLFGGLSLGVNLALLAVLQRGGNMVSSGALSSGDLFKFSIYSGMLGAGAAGFAGAAKDISKAAASARRVFELMDTAHALTSDDKGPQLKPESARIRFEDVVFRYAPGGPAVLDGLSLTLEPGRVTALVGNSGCGKTTTVQLLARLRVPEEGRVLFGEVDSTELSSEWLKDQVAVVEQNPTLFNASIYDNIVFGWRLSDGQPASLEAVQEAARQADAHTFISAKPEGYQTLVGPQGTCLSGGQVQRIAIARALLRKPKVLVFDEATSSMHAQAESEVHQAILRVCSQETAQCAVLLITHRLYLLKQCKDIHVLKKGKVVESGSFDELEAAAGPFKELLEAVVVDHEGDSL